MLDAGLKMEGSCGKECGWTLRGWDLADNQQGNGNLKPYNHTELKFEHFIFPTAARWELSTASTSILAL